jgi:CheY-like chemotaxis protein
MPPVNLAANPRMTATTPTGLPAAPAGASILVVDDNEQIGEMLVELLQRHGFNVRVAHNGRRALAHLALQPADLVITDIFMPDCDGLELLRQLQQLKPRPRVVAMSGGKDTLMPDILKIARLMGAEGAIKKPFETAQLLQLVRGLLGDPASVRLARPATSPGPGAP